jgi:hypothetical protein
MHTENLHNLYSSPNKVELSNWGGVGVGVCTQRREKCVQSGENFKRIKCFADLDVNGRIKLNRSSKEEDMESIGLIWLRIGDCGENFIILVSVFALCMIRIP